MAGRIQGITVEIGGDTTKLQTALKGVNTPSVSPAVRAAGAVHPGSGSFDHRNGERYVCGEPER